MNKWIAALALCGLASTAALAADTAAGSGGADVLKNMVNSPSADSWNVWNATFVLRDDVSVQAGKALRITARKSANAWDAQASSTLLKPIAKGDVILAAYWARVETPPKGAVTATIPNAGIGLSKPPYSSFAGEAAVLTGKWAMYYTSGVADADYPAGSLNFGVQLAGDDQVIDLGPVFVLDFGPAYDRTKLPHNHIPVTTGVAPTGVYDSELAKLRAKLPVPGTLINADPGTTYAYGPDATATPLSAPDIAGGKAMRVVIAKPGANVWDDGASNPVTTPVKRGDVIFTAALVRAAEPVPGAAAGLISEVGVHMGQAPYSVLATSSATLPKGAWTWIYASGVAAADYPAGAISFGMQLGASKQTIDVGPVFVLDLGPGIDTAALPNNFGKPF